MRNEHVEESVLDIQREKQLESACRAFILHEKKILLCKQKMRNFWTLPGGSVKEGETLVECISREIFEEIGVKLQIEQMLFIRELINSSRHRIEFYFSTKRQDNPQFYEEISPCNEIAETRFFTLEELSFIKLKPVCLPDLISETFNETSVFPRYLGNVN